MLSNLIQISGQLRVIESRKCVCDKVGYQNVTVDDDKCVWNIKTDDQAWNGTEKEN